MLVSEEDWNAIQETLFLLSIPGMGESIKHGMKESLSESSKELDWKGSGTGNSAEEFV